MFIVEAVLTAALLIPFIIAAGVIAGVLSNRQE